MRRKRVAILISGRGSNMAALIRASRAPGYPAEISLVLSDKPEAPGLAAAEQAEIETCVCDRAGFDGKANFEAAIDAKLRAANVDIVCLAGFMRLLSAGFVAKWAGRILNIHPSLLPSFPGLDTHRRVLEAGIRISGCTVHVVNAELDAGPIIAQAAVPVLPTDDEAALSARVLEMEHRLYPTALALFAAGQATPDSGAVRLDPAVTINGNQRLTVPDA